MSDSGSRWVVVDDTGPGITYTGPWFPDQGSQNSLGNFGPPYLSTLHGTDSDASFSYSFNGTRVMIVGTNMFQDLSGVTNPSWQCIVDGNISLPSSNVTVPENMLPLCDSGDGGLSDGPHVITVNVTVSNQQTFWFDYIQYFPSFSVSLAEVSLAIYTDDSQLHYGTGWSPLFPGNMTCQTGSTFSFEFNGTSLIWLGFYLNNLPSAEATYAVDGQSPTTFNLNSVDAETGAEYCQVFFQTAQLPPGPHNLDVVYQGNSATTPLTLSLLFVQNNSPSSSSLPTPASSSASSPSQPASSSLSGMSASGTPNNTPNGSRNVGAIVGGVIGGVGLLIFAILAILFLRQRKNRSSLSLPLTRQRPQETLTVSPSSVTGNNFRPTSLQVREEDAGIQNPGEGDGRDI